jgi:hypothetical protein
MDNTCPRPGCGGKLVLYYSRRTSGFTQRCFRCGGAWRSAAVGLSTLDALSRTPTGAPAR